MAQVRTEGAQTVVNQPPDPNTTKQQYHDDCVICLAPISDRAVAVPCNHCSFDFVCLASWTAERPTCPLCKADVSAIEYNWSSSDDFSRYLVPSLPSPHDAKQEANPRGRQQRRRRNSPDQPSAIDVALIRRRNVYRLRLYSLHVGSNRISGFRNITPAMISSSHELQARAKKWIRRELLVFEQLRQTGPLSPSRRWAAGRTNNAEYLLEHFVDLIKVVHVRGGEAEEFLAETLGREDAALFLHEFSSWIRSPFLHLEDWDMFVQYPARSKS